MINVEYLSSLMFFQQILVVASGFDYMVLVTK